MSIHSGYACLTCQRHAPVVGHDGLLGVPDLASRADAPNPLAPSLTAATFGYLYEVLADLGIHRPDLEQFAAWLRTHATHDVAMEFDNEHAGFRAIDVSPGGDADVTAASARIDAALVAGDVAWSTYEVRCRQCDLAVVCDGADLLRPIAPLDLAPEAVKRFTTRWGETEEEVARGLSGALELDEFVPTLVAFFTAHATHPLVASATRTEESLASQAAVEAPTTAPATPHKRPRKSAKPKPPVPRRLTLYGRDEWLHVTAFPEGVAVSTLTTGTVVLNRRDLATPVWKVEERWAPGYYRAGLLIGYNRGDTVARDAGDGRIVWCLENEKPRLVDGNLITLDGDRIILRDPDTREIRSESMLPMDTVSFGSFGRKVFFRPKDAPGDSGLLDIECGTVAWQRPLDAELDARRPAKSMGYGPSVFTIVAAHAPGRFFVRRVGGDLAPILACCDLATGAIQWVVQLGYNDCRDVTVVDERVVVADFKGMHVLHADTGAVLKTSLPPELARGWQCRRPIVYKNRVAITYESGELAVFDLATGNVVKVMKTKTCLSGGVEVDGRLVLGALGGTVLVFDPWIWGLE